MRVVALWNRNWTMAVIVGAIGLMSVAATWCANVRHIQVVRLDHHLTLVQHDLIVTHCAVFGPPARTFWYSHLVWSSCAYRV